jgi:hypothetical protein
LDKDSLIAAIRSAALSDVLRTMDSDDLSQKMLAKTRVLPDEILDAEAKKAGVPEDQWPLHQAMVRGEPNAFMDELEAVDGLLRPGDIILMTNPASMRLVQGQQKLFYKQARASHVALIHADFVCIDSMPSAGVTNRIISKLLQPAGDDWRVIRCKQVTDTDAVMRTCAYYLAQPYKVLPSKFSAKSYAYCSELARKVYVRCGVTDVGIPDDYVIAPAHFDKLADGVAGSPHWQDVTEKVRPAVKFCSKYAGLVDISVRLFIEGLQLNRKRYMQRTEALRKIAQLERSGKISKEKATEAKASIQATEDKMNHTFWDVSRPKVQTSSFSDAEKTPEPASHQESPAM